MGLIDLLTRIAATRAHVLVVEAPGTFRARVALERAVHHRGWCFAESVADADVLAVVGDPGVRLEDVVEHVWQQMSEPQARIHVQRIDEAEERLDEAERRLRATPARLDPGSLRHGFTPSAEQHQHGGHEEHGGHDHGSMAPAGIPLAEGGEDRDGLEMDELHLPLGPALRHWPAGLVLRVTLHGDVVVDAEAEQLGAASTAPPEDDAATRAAGLLHAVGSVLTLAGLPGEAARAWRLRDGILDRGRVGDEELGALATRIEKHRLLAWVLKGLRVAGSRGGSDELHHRLVDLVRRARAELAGEPQAVVPVTAEALARLVRGLELATVRLWVAALMPDLALTADAEVARG